MPFLPFHFGRLKSLLMKAGLAKKRVLVVHNVIMASVETFLFSLLVSFTNYKVCFLFSLAEFNAA